MTKEELKEAIAATITENGQKGITGQSLANLLIDIVDAAGESGGGNAGGDILCLDLKIDLETFEPILTSSDENLQFRQTLIEGLTNNKFYNVFIRYAAGMSGDLGEGITGNVYMVESRVASYQYTNVPSEGPDELVLFFDTQYNGTITQSQIVINSDGSLTISE